MSGIDALEHPKHIELLITRVRFPAGTPNGAALARMALVKRPGVKVIFASYPEMAIHTEGLGEFLPRPFSSEELLSVVRRRLDQASLDDWPGVVRPAGYAGGQPSGL